MGRSLAAAVRLSLGLVATALPALAASAAGAASPAWPPLADQMSAAGAPAGSALARLIAANQDLSLLRADEARDRRGLPPWLRVYWRKGHPEGRYTAADPTGGYPLVLKEVLEWMETHPDLAPPAARAAPAGRAATSGPERRISGAALSPRSESDIRIDFHDPQKVLAASNEIGGSGRQAVFSSSDGGATWSQTSLPLVSTDSFHSDPTVDWSSDGTAWSTTIGIHGNMLHLRAYKSTDHGATWTFDATYSGAQTATDKEMIWVDHSDTSPYKDNLYAIWHNGDPVYVNRRTGPAGAWQSPLQVSGGETTGTGIGADIKTNAAGDLFGLWPDTGSQRIYAVRSTDGGATFGAPVAVASTFGSFDIGVPAMDSRRALIYVTAGAYRTSVESDVFAAWADLSGAPGCAGPGDEPGADVASACKTRIWFARSTDGGATWSAAAMLNNPASLNDQFNPWLTVDESAGTLAVIYYDTVNDAGRLKVDVWYQSSYDRGATWSAPFKLTSAETDETAEGEDSGNQFGDYNSLSGYAGVFFPSWTDRRSNLFEEIWTAGVSDACTPPGPPTGTAAINASPNHVQVSWSASPPATVFDVYRATGSCASPGPYARIASGVSGLSVTDGSVSGGITYAYRVTAAAAPGSCSSGPSPCAQIGATGACTLPPSFAGLATATSSGTATCGLDLSWAAATPACSGPLAYDVYRSTDPGFVPAPDNRIATVAGTSFHDDVGLASDVNYTYVVRALDTGDGAEEGNLARVTAAPSGAALWSETFEGAGGFDHAGWSHAALSGPADWALSTAQSASPTHSWLAAEQALPADRVLVSPPLAVQAGQRLSFRHTFAFEGGPAACYDGGTLELSSDGGASWSTVPDAAFTAGGFNGTIFNGAGNPLAGKRAWCGGGIGPMTRAAVDLAAWAGQSVRLRWREGDDNAGVVAGWYVDSVALSAACRPGPGPLAFYTLTPCRVVDTRGPAGPTGAPALAASSQRTFVLAGACGIPAEARALALNVTVVQPGAAGDLRLFPSGQPAPPTSTISFGTGQIRANNAVTALSSGGAVTVQVDSAAGLQLLLDVTGYFR
ncbi:MAG TPA: hypothetical protein VIH93_13255 [Thermoanaerobaculia bacterium]